MQRYVLLVCSFVLLACQCIAAEIAAEQSSGGQSSKGAPRSESREPETTVSTAPQIRHAMRNETNAWLVGIISRGMEGTELWEATDLAASLHGVQDHLRILPIAAEGGVQNSTDIVFARGVDIGIIQSDVLDALKRDPPFLGIEKYLQYITKLYDEELHILAGADVHSLDELAAKKVNLGLSSSGTFATATAIFGALGLTVQVTDFPQAVALEKLRRGEISAVVCLTPKPARLFRDVRPDENLHFLSIPTTGNLPQSYAATTLTSKDYPELIEGGAPVSTVAVGTVLAAYNWPAGSDRYQKVARFVRVFFDRLHDLQIPPHHPKWRDINLAAAVPGWTRFAPAEQWIRKAELDNRGPLRHAALGEGMMQGGTAALSSQERHAIFREFVDYQKRQSRRIDNAMLDPPQRAALFEEFVVYSNGKFLQ